MRLNKIELNKKHLYWIIPVCVIIGILTGIGFMGLGVSTTVLQYPVISCILTMEDSLNVNGNKMPFTKKSQRAAIQTRCAQEYVDFNASYEDLLVIK